MNLRQILGAAIFAQSALVVSAQSTAKVVPTVLKKTLLQELNMPAIWFLILCSMLIVWFVVDVTMKSARKQLIPDSTLLAIRGYFKAGDYSGAFDYCAAHPVLFSKVVQAGLKTASAGPSQAEDAMANAILGGAARFQNTIAYLSVIGVIAPMVGLTGTVLGMIDAFAVMGQAGAADPSKLSGAIGHVLHATAGGLIVAIPAFVSYYILRNRVAHGVHELGVEIADLFRRFPYAELAEMEFRGGESYAAKPVIRVSPAEPSVA